MNWTEKVEIPVSLAGEPGEEQVRQLLRNAGYIRIERDALGNWHADLVGQDGWDVARLFYQNAGPTDVNYDDRGPITLCRAWDPLLPRGNEADMRLSPELGSLAVGVLRDLAAAAWRVLRQELTERWERECESSYCVLVASTASGAVRNLHSVARDDPAVLPILLDAWKEELP